MTVRCAVTSSSSSVATSAPARPHDAGGATPPDPSSRDRTKSRRYASERCQSESNPCPDSIPGPCRRQDRRERKQTSSRLSLCSRLGAPPRRIHSRRSSQKRLQSRRYLRLSRRSYPNSRPSRPISRRPLHNSRRMAPICERSSIQLRRSRPHSRRSKPDSRRSTLQRAMQARLRPSKS
jgi:hypothetical protein